MQHFHHSILARSLALLLAANMAILGCEISPMLGPVSGRIQYQEAGLVAVPGGFVNTAGGNLLMRRVDLSVDTLLGVWEVDAVYNSRAERWLWSFQMSYDGSTFVDSGDATHDVSEAAAGDPIPGTIWRVVDADTIRTKGGLAYDFDAAGRLESAHWASLAYPRIEYTWSEGLLELAQCTASGVCLPIYWVTLDDEAKPTSATDLRGLHSAEFVYDDRDRLVVARGPGDVEAGHPGFRYEYGTRSGLLTAATSSAGERVEYRYIDRGKIRGVDRVGEATASDEFLYYAKNPAGLFRTVHTNPLGGTTRYLFDEERRLHRIERDITGEAHAILWGPAGELRPRGEITAAGVATTYTFAGDELVEWVQPSGNVVSIEYEAGALNTDDARSPAVRRVTDSLGTLEERSYDAVGRLVSVTNGEGETTTRSYGAATLAAVTAPYGATRSYTQFGSHGHWLVAQGCVDARRSFDSVGNLQVPEVWGRRGGELMRAHDADRNLVAVEVAATSGGVVVAADAVTIGRRADGRVASVQRPHGADHEFVHDSFGRVIERRERVDGVWWATAFEYDLAGNVTARTRPNGMREEYAYDLYGRPVLRRALRHGVLEGEIVLTYFAGELVAIDDSLRDGSEAIGYDFAGRRSVRVFAAGESIAWEYDLRSRVVRETYSLPGVGAVRTIDTVYDLANRPVLLSTDGGEALSERVFRDGRVAEIRNGNGLVRTFEYEPESASMSGATTVDSDGGWVESTAVTRTLEADPVRHQVGTTTATALGSTEEQYWLGVWGSLQDPDKLVGKRVFAWNDGDGNSQAYAWDELSNLIDDVDGDRFHYNAEHNRLSSAEIAGVATDYVWDEAGFAIARAGVPIDWTATGRMAAFGPIELAWDMQDRLLSVTVGGVTRDYSRFGGRVESDPATGTPLTLDLGDVSLAFFGAERVYRHFDFRGNVSFVTDASGTVVNHYRYHPFGVDTVLGGGGNAATFVGRAEVGPLMLLGERMYDPVVGRFLSPDPVFSLFNQYAYALGNPVWFSDPDGRESGGIGASVDGGAARGVLEGATAALTFALYVTGTTAVAPHVFAGLAVLLVLVLIAEALAGNDSGVISRAPPSRGFAGSFAAGGLPATTEAIGAAAAGTGAIGTTCSPTALSSAERPRWLLGWILLLQISLGMGIRRRRRRGMSREEHPC